MKYVFASLLLALAPIAGGAQAAVTVNAATPGAALPPLATDIGGGESGRVLPSAFAAFAPQELPTVPEPASWVILILGFAMAGGLLRAHSRRRQLSHGLLIAR